MAIHQLLLDNIALSADGVQPMDVNLSKKPLKWAELGFQYIKTDFRYSAVFQDGDWLPGTLISEENMLIHEGAPSCIMLSSALKG